MERVADGPLSTIYTIYTVIQWNPWDREKRIDTPLKIHLFFIKKHRGVPRCTVRFLQLFAIRVCAKRLDFYTGLTFFSHITFLLFSLASIHGRQFTRDESSRFRIRCIIAYVRVIFRPQLSLIIYTRLFKLDGIRPVWLPEFYCTKMYSKSTHYSMLKSDFLDFRKKLFGELDFRFSFKIHFSKDSECGLVHWRMDWIQLIWTELNWIEFYYIQSDMVNVSRGRTASTQAVPD